MPSLFGRVLSSLTIVLSLLCVAPVAAAPGGRSICISSANGGRSGNQWSYMSRVDTAGSFSTSRAALASVQSRWAGGDASRLGLTPRHLREVSDELDLVPPGTLVETPMPSSGHFYPSHVSRETLPDGKRVLNEHYPDPGTCVKRWVGLVREIPLSPAGKPLYGKARWVRVNTDEAYEDGLRAWRAGRYEEAFRKLGHAASWSESMRLTIGSRVKAVLDGVPGFRQSLDRVRIPVGRSVDMVDAPHDAAARIRTLSSDDTVLRLHKLDADDMDRDGYVRLGTFGTWDMVYDEANQDVGFIRRLDGLGARASAASADVG